MKVNQKRANILMPLLDLVKITEHGMEAKDEAMAMQKEIVAELQASGEMPKPEPKKDN